MPWLTVAFVVVVVGVAAVDGALGRGRTSPRVLRRWSSTATTVASGPWRTITSIPLTSGARMTAGMCVVIVVLFGLAEWCVGWRTALAAGVAGTVLATLVCDVVLVAAGAAASATAHAPDFGPSAVTAAAAGAVARNGTATWAIVLAVVTLNGVVVHHQLPDWEHVVAFVVGFGAPAS